MEYLQELGALDTYLDRVLLRRQVSCGDFLTEMMDTLVFVLFFWCVITEEDGAISRNDYKKLLKIKLPYV